MLKRKVAPYGTWKSPITADLIVSDMVGLDMITTDSADVYWLEMRPKEGGRQVIVKRSPDGNSYDITPAEFSVGSRVHEYGGGAYAVKDSVVYFCNSSDQRIYRQEGKSAPTPITPVPSIPAGLRFADIIVDAFRDQLIAVCEDHTQGDSEPINTLVAIALDGSGTITTLASGHDFYSSPKLNQQGSKLAWLSWDHPNMPWDGTELHVAEYSAVAGASHRGVLHTPAESELSVVKALAPSSLQNTIIAGGTSESIFQPEWCPDGRLLFVSDRTGWWNIYCYDGQRIEPICPMPAEFGRAQWQFGFNTYAFESPDSIIATFNQNAIWKLTRINISSKTVTAIETEYTDIWWPKVANNKLVFRGASPQKLQAIIALDLATNNSTALKTSNSALIDQTVISAPQILQFPTTHGLTAHAFFYPPHNAEYIALENEKPPLLVKCHGGPTGTLSSGLNLELQYWTSRGFAVIDVNYGGSTGYGRQYRDKLYGNWGVVDVDDCSNAALYLSGQGLVDSKRLLISGRSSAGFTALCALAFKNIFCAGASHYGISDLVSMAEDACKFDARGLERLLVTTPSDMDNLKTRSPISHIEKIRCPIIFFQGSNDAIVPPNQTQIISEALQKRGVPVACLIFAGEGHGFRKAETIKRALESELYFYGRVLNFDPYDRIDPLSIVNADRLCTAALAATDTFNDQN